MHISGKDFDVMVGDLMIRFNTVSATITDNRKVVMTGGIPDGFANGSVSCAGELEVSSKYFNLIIESAKAAGSFRDLDPFDITCIARITGQEQKVELFDCVLTISDLLNADSNSDENTKHKLPFEVSGSDFVQIGRAHV